MNRTTEEDNIARLLQHIAQSEAARLHELLQEFAQYTPQTLIRLLADGAMAVLYVMPNVVGVVFFAYAVGAIIEKLTSLVGSSLVSLRIRRWAVNPQVPIGTPSGRIFTYLPIVSKNLLKAWIGLPVLYVLSLVLSDGSDAATILRGLVSGYAWQTAAIAALPLHTWLNLSHDSIVQVGISAAAAFFYVNNVYVYYANGFFLTKEIRKTSDLLLSVVAGGPNLTAEQIKAGLKRQGWTDEAVKSALWFLLSRNLRIVSDNPAFQQLTPQKYGLFRAGTSLGIVLGLKELHPLVAVLKVYFEKNDLDDVHRTMAIYRKQLARLPQPVQARLNEASPPA